MVGGPSREWKRKIDSRETNRGEEGQEEVSSRWEGWEEKRVNEGGVAGKRRVEEGGRMEKEGFWKDERRQRFEGRGTADPQFQYYAPL